MTIRIPLRVLLFVLYTGAILGGAFGISYAVFEWRDDDADSDGALTLESLDKRIDALGDRIDSVRTAAGAATSVDSSSCHNALKSMIFAVTEALATQSLGPALEKDIREADTAFNQHC